MRRESMKFGRFNSDFWMIIQVFGCWLDFFLKGILFLL
jgi:hypothetical protein